MASGRWLLPAVLVVVGLAALPATPVRASGRVTAPPPGVPAFTATGLAEHDAGGDYAASYPTVSGDLAPAILTAVNADIRRHVDDLSRQWLRGHRPTPVATAHRPPFDAAAGKDWAWLTYTPELRTSRYVSLVFSLDSYGAGAQHPNRSYDAVTIDLTSGRELTADDLFRTGSDYFTALAAAVLRASRCPRDVVSQALQFRTSIGRELSDAAPVGGQVAIALAPAGVAVDVAPYVLADFACGPTEAGAPYAQLAGVLSAETSGGVHGTNALDTLSAGGVTLAGVGFAGTTNPYVSQLKPFQGKVRRTRGFLPFACLRYGTPCVTARGRYRAEATAQAFAIREYSRLPGPNGRPRADTVDEPVGGEVDWEVRLPGDGPGLQRGDIVVDGRRRTTTLAEVKLWQGPATTVQVAAQLEGYLAAAGTLGIPLELDNQLTEHDWVAYWYSDPASDPEAVGDGVWWEWAGPPGQIYFARGDRGRKAARERAPKATPVRLNLPQRPAFPDVESEPGTGTSGVPDSFAGDPYDPALLPPDEALAPVGAADAADTAAAATAAEGTEGGLTLLEDLLLLAAAA